jgi:ribosomal protein L11
MSEEEREKIMKIAKLRALLEKRVEDMETELDGLKTMLSLIDSTLIKESFKRAEVTKPVQTPQKEETPQPSPIKPPKRGISLKTVTGDLLAQIYAEKDLIQITLAEDKNFDINIPPFTSFFVERVLAKMQEKDKEDASKGELDPEKIVSFNIKQDGNMLREITIRNLRPERSRELKSSIRWTLEKMFERMKQQT